MNYRLAGLVAVTAAFAVVTVIALLDVGYFGIIEAQLEGWGPFQVFADLVILAVLAIIWMVNDGRARGMNPWPFVLVTLAAGAFGPLLYLMLREVRARERQQAALPANA